MSAFAQFCEQHGLDPATLEADDAVAICKALSEPAEGDGQDVDEDTAINKAIDDVDGADAEDEGSMGRVLKSLAHATSGLKALVGIGKAVDESDLEDEVPPDAEGDEDLDLDYDDEDADGVEDDAEADIDAALDAAGVPGEEDEDLLRRSLTGLEKSLKEQGFDGVLDGNELMNAIMRSYDERDAGRTGKLVKSITAMTKSIGGAFEQMDERMQVLEGGLQRMGMIPAGAQQKAPYTTVEKSAGGADSRDIGGVDVPTDPEKAISRVRKALKNGEGDITAADVRTVELGYESGNPVPIAQVLSRIPEDSE